MWNQKEHSLHGPKFYGCNPRNPRNPRNPVDWNLLVYMSFQEIMAGKKNVLPQEILIFFNEQSGDFLYPYYMRPQDRFVLTFL